MLIINVQKNARKNINVDGTADDGKETANHDVKTLLATRDLLDAYQAYRVLYSALFVYYQNIVKLWVFFMLLISFSLFNIKVLSSFKVALS